MEPHIQLTRNIRHAHIQWVTRPRKNALHFRAILFYRFWGKLKRDNRICVSSSSIIEYCFDITLTFRAGKGTVRYTGKTPLSVPTKTKFGSVHGIIGQECGPEGKRLTIVRTEFFQFLNSNRSTRVLFNTPLNATKGVPEKDKRGLIAILLLHCNVCK